MEGTPKVVILCPYPLGISPGQRFRFEQYLEILRGKGIRIDIQPFLDMGTMQILYKPGHLLRKVLGVLLGFGRRMAAMFSVLQYDYVFIYREASPLGPPIFETILFLLRRKVIFDFDDAIFIRSTSSVNRLIDFAKWSSKIQFITRHSSAVSVCNRFLIDWARQFNKNVVLVPTTIDADYHKPISKPPVTERTPIIGWTGTHSTMGYLDLVRPALAALQEKYDFEFRVICNVDPGFGNLKNYRFIKWQLATEIDDLGAIDIGLMPVPEGEWEQGKVGFKAIQYSGVEAVPVVSSTGSGHEVVLDGKTGLVISNDTDSWIRALSSLLEKPQRIATMGKAAREYIVSRYSVRSQAETYAGLFGK
jgi:glycosyltransferase involved in cell wall biosynthesis